MNSDLAILAKEEERTLDHTLMCHSLLLLSYRVQTAPASRVLPVDAIRPLIVLVADRKTLPLNQHVLLPIVGTVVRVPR